MSNEDEPIVWVVDLCHVDDYRHRDAEFFHCHNEALEYIEWLEDQVGTYMVVFGGPYSIKKTQIQTLAQAMARYEDLYHSED